jgi:biofilm PGA synthesis N-glycosyltransferase PgaC
MNSTASYISASLELRDNLPMSAWIPNYVIITPVRDEEDHLRTTIECMIQQEIRPQEWVIVNDGSTDGTAGIIDEYAGRYPWIHGLHRKNRGFRKSGGGVVEAFNEGYNALVSSDWDYLVKFDGDLSFEPDYFKRCLDNFAREPKLGVGGGVIWNLVEGERQKEECPAFHVRGATKIYRRDCWEAIGGFWPAPGWDTMDEVKANMLGWNSRTFDELCLTHHRVTGAADGLWKNLVKNGRANYICGYHPLFMLGKCAKRLLQPPFLVGSAGLFYGFITGYFKRIPQVDDRAAIAYLRRQQLNRLRGAESIWK